ncbi:fatty acid desaturase family protein [Ottowia sp. VDI28]|uniref:fatty acid desaturase family protein n=1 Tax=Ottowia sp. VDI28 TaxID=3133968 RepID=UPI003C2C4337
MTHPQDARSVVCLLAWPMLLALLYGGWLGEWAHGVAYALLIYLSLALVVIEHNHMHLRIWRRRGLNRATDTLLSMFTGHACHVFHATHNANHHRYHHGPLDAARTYRFAQGDTNHLAGYLLHPAQALGVLWPLIRHWHARLKARAPAVQRYYQRQWLWVIIFHTVLAAINPLAWGLYVLLPQMLALHWLLGANYLQHAHADGHSRLQFARNFTGGVNHLFFNIGYHTAHHLHPKVHWSELPAWHQRYAPQLHTRLTESSLLRYVLVTLTIGMLRPGAASLTLMRPAPSPTRARPLPEGEGTGNPNF